MTESVYKKPLFYYEIVIETNLDSFKFYSEYQEDVVKTITYFSSRYPITSINVKRKSFNGFGL